MEEIHAMLMMSSQGPKQVPVSKSKRGKGKLNNRTQIVNQIDAALLSLDIVQDKAYECSIDQKCSRFIQERLRLDIGQREQFKFFDKLLKDPSIDFEKLVKDQNGNYVVQRIQLNTTSNQEYHDIIFRNIKGQILDLSNHKHGCRVI